MTDINDDDTERVETANNSISQSWQNITQLKRLNNTKADSIIEKENQNIRLQQGLIVSINWSRESRGIAPLSML